MQRYVIKDITVINENQARCTDVLIEGERFARLGPLSGLGEAAVEIDGHGKFLIPGVIDDQVHFREPGFPLKGTIFSESRAAVAGGTTSFMEMPNTKPPALTQELLEQKYQTASANSLANYSFYMGVSNENLQEVLRTNEKRAEVCGVKVFLGSSTGNLLVDNFLTLDRLFAGCGLPLAAHCEDEKIIHSNLELIQGLRGGLLTVEDHPLIRDDKACFQSSLTAIQLAMKHRTRLHILHISTALEMQLFSGLVPLEEKKITAEVCVHHLYFSSEDYATLGNQIKCNPAIKTPRDREALWKGLAEGRLDVIATDHAPHTWEEKQNPYPQAPAGIPLVQHGLLMMLEHHQQGRISMEELVTRMCHGPAICFGVAERGFIREGYFADCVILDPDQITEVRREDLLYRCGWSPFVGHLFPAAITHTFVNGHLAYENGRLDDSVLGKRLHFNR
ncbi:MAG TPA: dihydroorotase [Chitinophagaceae bacterium]|nr:dihydroorotase [Chitinophagaceae bacterium]